MPWDLPYDFLTDIHKSLGATDVEYVGLLEEDHRLGKRSLPAFIKGKFNMPIRPGANNQSDNSGGGGALGQLPDGKYPIELHWGLKTFAEGGPNMPGGTKLSLFVTGHDVTERMSAGNGTGVVIVDGSKAIDNPGNPNWQLNRGTKAAAFLRAFEKALGSDLDESMKTYDGLIVRIQRMDYHGMVGPNEKNPTFAMVMEAAFAQGAMPVSTDMGFGAVPVVPEPVSAALPLPAPPLGSPVLAPTPEVVPPTAAPLTSPWPAQYITWATQTIASLVQGQTRVELKGLAPDAMATHLPNDCQAGDDKIAVIKMLMEPLFLSVQAGWLYDREQHALINL